MSKGEVMAHGKKYSKTYSFKGSVWQDNFDAMGKKTVLKQLLRTYGKLGKDTQKLAKALEVDQGFIEDFDTENIKYYDNPNNSKNDDFSVEVEDDFKEDALTKE
jgi:recombination protein RecT